MGAYEKERIITPFFYDHHSSLIYLYISLHIKDFTIRMNEVIKWFIYIDRPFIILTYTVIKFARY